MKDLEAFTKKLEAQGTKLDEAIRLAPNGTTKVAYLTDPWGTRIELTQNLAPANWSALSSTGFSLWGLVLAWCLRNPTG